ncbi:glutathione S-transferase [Psychromonas sp. psych-6C06]|uniref:glutathione S-transferase family protein n=1 Tax=Psychromonas sp. psych-6C06 TaxID=2058089 RepID=UPI000C3382B2|nr:glutathione S-transferase family protein [Psychromonas sp. psych-6C06]PKF61013.1 glutathione S-transferase [Psychromonas sp. psych-6C06]
MKIYADIKSGNCYKIALLCSLLKIPHQWIAIDILKGETSTAEFLQKNPNGKIPLLETDDGRFLSESNAILNYLANGSALLPDDVFERASLLQWQFFEQYSHEPFIAVARYINVYLGLPESRAKEYEALQTGGHNALKVMETQLEKGDFLLGENLSIADISLYAYTHVAHEGGFDLSAYPAILAWIKRINSLPDYVSMNDFPSDGAT